MPAVAAVMIAGCGGGGIPSDAVVSVDGTSITKATFNHWMTVADASSSVGTTGKPAVPEPPGYTACIAHLAKVVPKPVKGQSAPTTKQLKSQCEQQYKSLQQQVLGFLISSQWVLSEAQSLGVKVSDAEVHKEFTKIKATQFPKAAEFDKFMQTSGQSVSDLLLRVKLNMLSSKIQKQVVKEKSNVTQAQIAKYYNEHKSRYGTPEKRDVAIVLTKTEAAANSAKKEIESGKSFAGVARKDSIDLASKASGGLRKEVVKGEEDKALDSAIFSAAKNALGGPVKTPLGYYVYEVVSATPGTQEPLSKAQASIKQQLIATAQQSALAKFVKDFKARWPSKTECRTGYVVAECKSYKAPKTTPAKATGTVK